MTQQQPPIDPFGLSPDETYSLEGSPGSRTPLFEANNAARYQRQTIIREIQGRTGRRLLCYVSGNDCIINNNDIRPFVDLLHHVKSGEKLDLLLHTMGGSGDAAEKLVRMIRRRIGQAELRVIVPEIAKSAGTLIVLGADCVVMSDMSELGPIDPQMRFADSSGLVRWHPVQNYLDAYEELSNAVNQNPNNVAAQLMLSKLDPATVKLCQAAMERTRTCAEGLLQQGMFRETGNWTRTVGDLLDTVRWLSHSQMISWEDAQHPNLGLVVEHLEQQSDEWQEYWRLYSLQRLAIKESQKLFESAFVSLPIHDPAN